jgi:hypothetical protein
MEQKGVDTSFERRCSLAGGCVLAAHQGVQHGVLRVRMQATLLCGSADIGPVRPPMKLRQGVCGSLCDDHVSLSLDCIALHACMPMLQRAHSALLRRGPLVMWERIC